MLVRIKYLPGTSVHSIRLKASLCLVDKCKKSITEKRCFNKDIYDQSGDLALKFVRSIYKEYQENQFTITNRYYYSNSIELIDVVYSDDNE